MTDTQDSAGDKTAGLAERLRNAAESWKRTDCMIAREVLSEAALLDEAATAIELSAAREGAMAHALAFYADPKRYQGPNQRAVENDPYNPRGADAVYYHDVNRDRGEIARAALSDPEGKSP